MIFFCLPLTPNLFANLLLMNEADEPVSMNAYVNTLLLRFDVTLTATTGNVQNSESFSVPEFEHVTFAFSVVLTPESLFSLF